MRLTWWCCGKGRFGSRSVSIRPGTTQLAAVAGELVREGPREPDQAGLGRHHVGALFGARVTAEATNVDDGAKRHSPANAPKRTSR